MKKFIMALLCLFLFSTPVFAQEQGPPLEIVETFETFPIEVLQGGKLYSGVLMSEPEYNRVVSLEVSLLTLEEKLEIYEKSNEQYDKIISKWTDFSQDIKSDVQGIKTDILNQETSFWNEHKFEIGVTLGIITTVLVVLAVQ